MAGELHVFNASQKWVLPDTKAYKIRKSHSKSHSGCKTCKLRRIKCDEDKPRCGNCRRRGMICAYAGDDRPPLPLWPERKTPLVLANDDSAFTTEFDLEMLHHFIKVVGPDIYSKEALNTRAIDIWSLAQSVPHVMHAVLAAGALHLNATSNNPPHTLIQTGHWVDASSSFRTALSTMSWSTNPDPVLTTCMLLNLLSFANVDVHAPITSRWPLAPDIPGADPLQWFSVQLGLSPILTGLSARTKGQSIWLPLFIASNNVFLYDERDGTVDIPSSWCRLFNITDASKIEEHTYLRPVRRVTLLRSIYDDLESTHEASGLPGCPDHDVNSVKYLQFVQGVSSQHIHLLSQKDPLMMLLYVHWMAMLCAVKHWWCWPRARAETGAVVRYLDEVHGEWLGREGWLDFPARAVSYELKWKERKSSSEEISDHEMRNGDGGEVLDVEDIGGWEEVDVENEM